MSDTQTRPIGPAVDWHPEPELIGLREEAISRPALREAGPRTRLLALGLLALVAVALLPAAASAAPRPGESCFDQTAPPTGEGVCADVNDPDAPAGGSLGLGLLLPIVAAAVGGAVLALAIGYLYVRRRPLPVAEPADPGEWWTCRSCGSNNVIGSARCYSCGSWRG
ncbi:MAG TPA: hypothetical protein VM451_05835 [Candidatus Limnocylindria bacterium]|nr:hypothetical protein [Candidatus Limnocylindria bacterium]